MRAACRISLATTLLAVSVVTLGPACQKSKSTDGSGSVPPSSTPGASSAETAAVAAPAPSPGGATIAQPRAATRATAGAQGAGDIGADGPAATPAGNAISAKARRLLAHMIAAYQGAQRYQDDTEFRIVQTQTGPLRVRFERPNRVDARIADARIVSDGKHQSVYLPHLRQHVVEQAPDAIDPRNLYGDTVPGGVDALGPLGPLGRVSVPLQLVLAKDPWEAVLENVVAVSVDEAPVQIDGRAHDVVRLDRNRGDTVLYVDQQSGLIRRIEIDISDMLPVDSSARLVYVLEIKGAAVDGAQEPFEFHPPAGSEKVEAFDLFDVPEGPASESPKASPPQEKSPQP